MLALDDGQVRPPDLFLLPYFSDNIAPERLAHAIS
jgi:hypothetical protein